MVHWLPWVEEFSINGRGFLLSLSARYDTDVQRAFYAQGGLRAVTWSSCPRILDAEAGLSLSRESTWHLFQRRIGFVDPNGRWQALGDKYSGKLMTYLASSAFEGVLLGLVTVRGNKTSVLKAAEHDATRSCVVYCHLFFPEVLGNCGTEYGRLSCWTAPLGAVSLGLACLPSHETEDEEKSSQRSADHWHPKGTSGEQEHTGYLAASTGLAIRVPTTGGVRMAASGVGTWNAISPRDTAERCHMVKVLEGENWKLKKMLAE